MFNSSLCRLLQFVSVLSGVFFAVSSPAAETYTYDAAGRLTHVVYVDSSWITYTYDANGNITKIQSQAPTDVKDIGQISPIRPISISIDAITPNPTTAAAIVRYHITDDTRVVLSVVDAIGRESRVLDSRVFAGTHEVDLSVATRELTQGMYRIVLRAGVASDAKTLIVVR